MGDGATTPAGRIYPILTSANSISKVKGPLRVMVACEVNRDLDALGQFFSTECFDSVEDIPLATWDDCHNDVVLSVESDKFQLVFCKFPSFVDAHSIDSDYEGGHQDVSHI